MSRTFPAGITRSEGHQEAAARWVRVADLLGRRARTAHVGLVRVRSVGAIAETGQMNVTIDNGPLWLQYLVAFGTAGAAVFAAFAALSARSAARASRDLVAVETTRDERLAEDARWRQARRITVDLMGQEGILAPSGRRAHDMHLIVMNASPDPIFKARLKVVSGDAAWGPQLVGTIAPWQRIELTVRLMSEETGDNADAFVRFTDVEGGHWVANARSAVTADERPVDAWIAEGRAFAQKGEHAPPAERGTLAGLGAPPDLEQWRADVAGDGESWQPLGGMGSATDSAGRSA